jgi:hypothetical protein
VAKKEPASSEYLLQFLTVDVLLVEDTLANQAVIGIHQALDIRNHGAPPQNLDAGPSFP